MNNTSSFIQNFFIPELQDLLKIRAPSFRIILDILERKEKKNFLILETGTSRQRDNWGGDGQSTRVWDFFVNYYDGRVFSVDIDINNCKAASEMVSSKTTIVCSDSVPYIAKTFPDLDKVDLLYLDSYDVDFDQPHPSALHHLKELCACYSSLPSGCIIAVDDHNFGKGKGMYVADFMSNLDIKPIYSGYQIVFVKP